jgi:hypothetical protein
MSRSQSGAQFLDWDEFPLARERAMHITGANRMALAYSNEEDIDRVVDDRSRRSLARTKKAAVARWENDILPPAPALPFLTILRNSHKGGAAAIPPTRASLHHGTWCILVRVG